MHHPEDEQPTFKPPKKKAIRSAAADAITPILAAYGIPPAALEAAAREITRTVFQSSATAIGARALMAAETGLSLKATQLTVEMTASPCCLLHSVSDSGIITGLDEARDYLTATAKKLAGGEDR